MTSLSSEVNWFYPYWEFWVKNLLPWQQLDKGKYHGTVDIGLSVIAFKKKGRRIDVDADDIIYHLKVGRHLSSLHTLCQRCDLQFEENIYQDTFCVILSELELCQLFNFIIWLIPKGEIHSYFTLKILKIVEFSLIWPNIWQNNEQNSFNSLIATIRRSGYNFFQNGAGTREPANV